MAKTHMAKTQVIPVIMSGGAGSRLWPASRKSRPKQLLPLASQQTMIQETALRLQHQGNAYSFADPMIVCNHANADAIAKQLGKIGISASTMITEPVARNTAPCAVIAALAILAESSDRSPEPLMLLAPADHHIKNTTEFRRVVGQAVPAARSGHMVTFGITVTKPETGYGYIQKGAKLDDHAHRVAGFKEKPDLDTAKTYMASGNYFWNAGIFMCKPSSLLAEMRQHSPEILQACQRAFDASPQSSGQSAGQTIALDADTFARCPAISIDYALMERTNKACVVEAHMGWSDIGSWSALLELTKDMSGNALKGDVHILDTKNCLIHSDGPFVATIGIDNLAVVVHDGAVLIANLDQVQDVKKIVDELTRRRDKDRL